MRKLKVLQFITPSGFYGAERWILALANNLDASQVVCDLAITDEGAGQDLSVAKMYPESAGDVHYIPMGGRFDVRAISHLVQIIKDREIDIIHTHGYKSDILGYFAARKAGITCLSTPHGFDKDVDLKLNLFIKLGTFFFRFFDAVAPLSEELYRDMERFKVSKEKNILISNGVDLKDIDAEMAVIREAQTAASDVSEDPRVGFVGQMIKRKGIPDLLEIFDGLYAKNSRCKLDLLGEGIERESLELKAKSLQSADAINFLGFRKDRLELMSKFSIFIMTSSLEGIPRCMMEAMAIGIPVVAYDIPGIDLLIEHEKTGLLAHLGDKEALQKQCERLLEDKALRDRLVWQARTSIEENYSAKRMAREYAELFARLQNGRDAGSAIAMKAE